MGNQIQIILFCRHTGITAETAISNDFGAGAKYPVIGEENKFLLRS